MLFRSVDGGHHVRQLFEGSRPIPDVRRLLGLARVPGFMRPWLSAAARAGGRRIEAEALLATGVADPDAHVILYRSAWNARILISPTAWSAADIAALKAFCEARSFDVSWAPGMDVVAARTSLFNDLPKIGRAHV